MAQQLTSVDLGEVYLVGRDAAIKAIRTRPDVSLISIRDPREVEAEGSIDLFPSHTGRRLNLVFDDGSRSQQARHWVLPRLHHARKIVEFARELPPGSPLVVHCGQGIARSSAALIGVIAARTLDPGELNLHRNVETAATNAVAEGWRLRDMPIAPNPRLVALIDIELRLEGELVRQTIEAWDQRPPAWTWREIINDAREP